MKELNNERYGTNTPNKFDRLRWAWIVGVIDSNGVVYSKSNFFLDQKTHEDLFPLIHQKRWRWSFSDCINSSIYADTFEDGDFDKIRNHLRREYGIRFWENGYHDLDYFCSKLSKNK